MRLNVELTRDILLYLLNDKNNSVEEISIESFNSEEINEHISPLFHANYVTGTDITNTMGTVNWFNVKLTVDGHDFACVIENEKIWAKINEDAAEKGLPVTTDFIERYIDNVHSPNKYKIEGDQINNSGSFVNTNLSIKSVLTNASQTINDISYADQSQKDTLNSLMEELSVALSKVPTGNEEETEAVAEIARALIETISKETQNKTLIKITGDGLKKAAENIATVAPAIITIAMKIVDAIQVTESSI